MFNTLFDIEKATLDTVNEILSKINIIKENIFRKNFTQDDLELWQRIVDNVHNTLRLGLMEFEFDIEDIVERCCIYVKLIDVDIDPAVSDRPALKVKMVIDKKSYCSRTHFPSNKAQFLQEFKHISTNLPYCIKFKVFDVENDNKLIGEEELSISNTFLEHIEPRSIPIFKAKKEPEVLLKMSYCTTTNALWVHLKEGKKFVDSQLAVVTAITKVRIVYKNHDRKKAEKLKIKSDLTETDCPQWQLKQLFDPPEGTTAVCVYVCVYDTNKKSIMTSKEIQADLLTLEREPIKQWYTLHRKKKIKNQAIGNLTLELAIRREMLLPESKYDLLYQNVMDGKLHIVKVIDSLSRDTQEKREILKPIVHVLQYRGEADTFVKGLLFTEIDTSWDCNVLFRENSSPCLAMELHLHSVGRPLLKKILQEPLEYYHALNYEFNPDNEIHKNEFFKCLDTIWDNITDCIDDIPFSIRKILRDVKDKMHTGDEEEKRCVINFLFLRFFCIALAYPHHFDIVDFIPTAKTEKFYKLLSKTMMNLASGSESKDDDPRINKWILQNAEQMEIYIDAVVDIEDQDAVTELDVDFQQNMLHVHMWLSKKVLSIKNQFDVLTEMMKKKKSRSLKNMAKDDRGTKNKLEGEKRSRSRSGSEVLESLLPRTQSHSDILNQQTQVDSEYREFLDRIIQSVVMLNDMTKQTGRMRSISLSG